MQEFGSGDTKGALCCCSSACTQGKSLSTLIRIFLFSPLEIQPHWELSSPNTTSLGPGTGRKGLNQGTGWEFVHLPSLNSPRASNTRIPGWTHRARDCLPKSSGTGDGRVTSPAVQGSLEEPIPALPGPEGDPRMLLQLQVLGNAVAARWEH